MQHKMSYLRKAVGCDLSPKNQNLQELWLGKEMQGKMSNLRMVVVVVWDLNPNLKIMIPIMMQNLAKEIMQDKNICSNYWEKVVV